VTNDEQNPLTDVTLTVAEGAAGTSTLYEDDGVSTDPARSATTKISYARSGGTHRLTVAPARGSFPGQVARRTWTVSFTNATAPTTVRVNGRRLPAEHWAWNAATGTLTVHAPAQSVRRQLVVSYR
jgi:hypothetical protein